MTETIQIFSGMTSLTNFTLTDNFQDATFVYAIAPDVSYEVEFDAFLQIYLTPTQQRLIRLENFNLINTEATSLIPLEYRNSGFSMSVGLRTEAEINLEIYVVKPNCCSTAQLTDIQNQLNRIETEILARTAAEVIANALGTAIGTVVSPALTGIVSPVLAPAIREGFKVLNPVTSTEPIYLNYGNSVSNTNYMNIIYPGQEYVDEFKWQGAVNAITESGEATVQVHEFY